MNPHFNLGYPACSVHERKVEELMLAALPYHETEQFVRLVQILRLEPRSRFAFLEPMQKSGAPAPREALVLRCLTDRVSGAGGQAGGGAGRACSGAGQPWFECWVRGVHSPLASHGVGGAEAVALSSCCHQVLRHTSLQSPQQPLLFAAPQAGRDSQCCSSLPLSAVAAALCVRHGAAAG